MVVEFKDGGAYLTGDTIYPEVVFECGQCFRFFPEGEVYKGIAFGKVICVKKIDNGIYIFPCTQDDFNKTWKKFFDFNLSYTDIEKSFSNDEILSKAIESSKGMRLLVQEPFETIISFIISANNNIGRIRKIIEKICMMCGNQIEFDNRVFYAFPTPYQLSKLSVEQLIECGAGYRAQYIKETAECIKNGFDIDRIFSMEYKDAKKYLLSLKGVGPKVADCILLFAYDMKKAFPVDVWMRRVLNNLYNFDPKNSAEAEKFPVDHFGDYAGIAQQYLFNYARLNKII